MNHYEAALARMNDWTEEAEVLDRIIAENDEDARRRIDGWVTDARRGYELAFATELDRIVDERGRGVATTHDVALATSSVATQFGRDYDRRAVAETLERDPEPIGDDYLPLGAGGQRVAAASVRRDRPPTDDDEFEARVAAFAAESHRILTLAREGYVSASSDDIRSLRSLRGSLAALFPQAVDERYLPLRN